MVVNDVIIMAMRDQQQSGQVARYDVRTARYEEGAGVTS